MLSWLYLCLIKIKNKFLKMKIKKILLGVAAVLLFACIITVIVTSVEIGNYEKEIAKIKAQPTFSIELKSVVEHKELTLNDCTIHYYTSGDTSQELVVLLHPAFGDHHSFDKQIDAFSSCFRVVSIDLLGHGLSNTENTSSTIDLSTAHIEAIMKAESYEKAHFVGVSMGTLIAQYFALQHPEKVSSMTALGGYDINADNAALAKEQSAEQKNWLWRIVFSMDSFRKYVANVSLFKAEEKVRFYEQAKHFTRKSFQAMAGLENVVKLRPDVKRTYPLLILCGEKDQELALRMSQKWHQEDRTSEFYTIKNAGHCANMDNPSEFNSLVFNFLSKKSSKKIL
jgi:pimeloyl-ACP methyl ester carboxylesterase